MEVFFDSSFKMTCILPKQDCESDKGSKQRSKGEEDPLQENIGLVYVHKMDGL